MKTPAQQLKELQDSYEDLLRTIEKEYVALKKDFDFVTQSNQVLVSRIVEHEIRERELNNEIETLQKELHKANEKIKKLEGDKKKTSRREIITIDSDTDESEGDYGNDSESSDTENLDFKRYEEEPEEEPETSIPEITEETDRLLMYNIQNCKYLVVEPFTTLTKHLLDNVYVQLKNLEAFDYAYPRGYDSIKNGLTVKDYKIILTKIFQKCFDHHLNPKDPFEPDLSLMPKKGFGGPVDGKRNRKIIKLEDPEPKKKKK